MDVRGLITLGPAMDRESFDVPENVVVVGHAPHDLVFPQYRRVRHARRPRLHPSGALARRPARHPPDGPRPGRDGRARRRARRGPEGEAGTRRHRRGRAPGPERGALRPGCGTYGGGHPYATPHPTASWMNWKRWCLPAPPASPSPPPPTLGPLARQRLETPWVAGNASCTISCALRLEPRKRRVLAAEAHTTSAGIAVTENEPRSGPLARVFDRHPDHVAALVVVQDHVRGRPPPRRR